MPSNTTELLISREAMDLEDQAVSAYRQKLFAIAKAHVEQVDRRHPRLGNPLMDEQDMRFAIAQLAPQDAETRAAVI